MAFEPLVSLAGHTFHMNATFKDTCITGNNHIYVMDLGHAPDVIWNIT